MQIERLLFNNHATFITIDRDTEGSYGSLATLSLVTSLVSTRIQLLIEYSAVKIVTI